MGTPQAVIRVIIHFSDIHLRVTLGQLCGGQWRYKDKFPLVKRARVTDQGKGAAEGRESNYSHVSSNYGDMS